MAVVTVLLQVADGELFQRKSPLVGESSGVVGDKMKVCLEKVQVAVMHILAVEKTETDFRMVDHSAVVLDIDAALLPAVDRVVRERRVPLNVLDRLQVFMGHFLPRGDSAEDIDDAVGLLLSFLGIIFTEQAAAVPAYETLAGEPEVVLRNT